MEADNILIASHFTYPFHLTQVRQVGVLPARGPKKLRLDPNKMEALVVGAASCPSELYLACSRGVCTHPKFGGAPKSVTRVSDGLGDKR